MVDTSLALISPRATVTNDSQRSYRYGEFLIPSQAHGSRSFRKRHSTKTEKMLLVPSQVLRAHPERQRSSLSSSIPKSSKQRNHATETSGGDASPTSDLRPTARTQTRRLRPQNPRKKPSKPPRYGNLPDIEWRAVPMDHLRQHPKFMSLPHPSSIRQLESVEDIRYYRQDSWQWEAVHAGRCTTSTAVAALGFLEPQAGSFLGVPKSWKQGGGQGAYHRLLQPAFRTLEELNAVLCVGHVDDNYGIEQQDKSTVRQSTNNSTEDSLWVPTQRDPAQGGTARFVARYNVIISRQEIERRRVQASKRAESVGFDFAVRMMWGEAQEATAILTALNYFCSRDDGVVLKEVGMCGAGLASNTTNKIGLLVGASPDALICHSDGTIEALEVKNHSPFFALHPQDDSTEPKRFTIRYFGFDNVTKMLPPHYAPQLMMEMLCVGPACKSVVMVRQSATTGALILRVKRDDKWIEEMLYWLRRFHEDYVSQEVVPPENFFYSGGSAEDCERYEKFLEYTKDLASNNVEVLEHVAHKDIQRAFGEAPPHLFLD